MAAGGCSRALGAPLPDSTQEVRHEGRVPGGERAAVNRSPSVAAGRSNSLLIGCAIPGRSKR